jgi:hypothetical protein
MSALRPGKVADAVAKLINGLNLDVPVSATSDRFFEPTREEVQESALVSVQCRGRDSSRLSRGTTRQRDFRVAVVLVRAIDATKVGEQFDHLDEQLNEIESALWGTSLVGEEGDADRAALERLVVIAIDTSYGDADAFDQMNQYTGSLLVTYRAIE